MVTIKDIADKLNVSASTVSRALNNKEGLSEELRGKIKRAALEMGYYPNSKARALVMGRVGVIGVVIPRSSEFTFSTPLYPLILKGIAGVVNKLNYHILLFIAEGDVSYSSLYLQGLVDGIIVVAHRIDDKKARDLEERNIPTVLIPGYLEGEASIFPSVSDESNQGVFYAAEHLIGLGHTKIAFLGGAHNSKFSIQRLEGYRRAFQKHNIPLNRSYIVETDFREKDGYSLMKKLLSLPNPPTAVIGINDNVTIGAIHAIHRKNMRIPKDISVITIGDSEYVANFTPALTAVQIPMVEIGKRAAEALLKVLDGVRLRKKDIVLPTKLIVRDSTDRPSY